MSNNKRRILFIDRDGTLIMEPPDEQEKKTLSEEDLSAGYRLACQAIVTGNMTVTVPEDSRIAESKIL